MTNLIQMPSAARRRTSIADRQDVERAIREWNADRFGLRTAHAFAEAEESAILGRHADRFALAKEFGATDVVSERGDEAVERVKELTGGFGVHSVLGSVGTEQAMFTAVNIAHPGGAVGRVGVPHYPGLPAWEPTFYHNITISGGPAPVRSYIAELLPDVLEGRIQPGRVFDRSVGIDQVPEGYRAMDERDAIKVMVKP